MTDENKNEENKLNYYRGKFLHPSLDIKIDLMIIGFRYIHEDLEEKKLFISSDESKIKFIEKERFNNNGQEYFIDCRERKLAKINDRWDLEKLLKFIDAFNSGKEINISLKKIFNNIVKLSKKYIELEKEEDYLIITAWIIGTYFSQAFSAIPYLHIKAPKRSGKTQCLNLINRLAFNAIKSRPTLATLGDTVDALHGTYLIDQADSLGGYNNKESEQKNKELLEILTDSYKKEGGNRSVMGMDKKREVLEFETYGPKVFASIGELDEDLVDRCIIVPLIRSDRNFLEPSEDNENWNDIRGEIYKLLLTHSLTIKSYYNTKRMTYKNNQEILGRELEIWLPLETILSLSLEEKEINLIRERFKQLYCYSEYNPNDLEKEIINTIYQLFINKNEIELILKPKDIREKMNDEIWYNFIDTNQKKDIRVGKIVKKFNLTTNKITSSEGVAYQFQKDKIEKIRKTVFKAEDNSPDSPLSENNQEATPISYEELPEEARQNDEPTPINEEIPF